MKFVLMIVVAAVLLWAGAVVGMTMALLKAGR